MTNFIDELIAEAEEREQKLMLSHVDLMLKEIGDLQLQIEKNFSTADEEKAIIDQWCLSKNSKLNDRIEWLTKKLEAFMNEQGDEVKTIDLPNGKLLRRKQQDKFEIVDMEEFLKNKKLYQISTVQPEIIKPNLNMVKAFYKMTQKIPRGCKLIEGYEKFSVKIKQGGKDDGEEEAGTESEYSHANRVAV